MRAIVIKLEMNAVISDVALRLLNLLRSKQDTYRNIRRAGITRTHLSGFTDG